MTCKYPPKGYLSRGKLSLSSINSDLFYEQKSSSFLAIPIITQWPTHNVAMVTEVEVTHRISKMDFLSVKLTGCGCFSVPVLAAAKPTIWDIIWHHFLAGDNTLSDLKLHCKAIVTNTTLYWHKIPM